ncbi:hypothetical protein N510_003033 [Firmicutes bacterium ASF500]|nr:hypothetical protein N510_003033 [Firmicutes bacterium ASF500]
MTMEDRVTQLEEQTAALSVQALADARAPSGYYTSRYSGEQIDALLDGIHGNINLVDNWYFVGPINQRGQSTYTGITYTIDRWRMWFDHCKLLIVTAQSNARL